MISSLISKIHRQSPGSSGKETPCKNTSAEQLYLLTTVTAREGRGLKKKKSYKNIVPDGIFREGGTTENKEREGGE